MIKLQVKNHSVRELRLLYNWLQIAADKVNYCDGHCKYCNERKICTDFENATDYIHNLLLKYDKPDIKQDVEIKRLSI